MNKRKMVLFVLLDDNIVSFCAIPNRTHDTTKHQIQKHMFFKYGNRKIQLNLFKISMPCRIIIVSIALIGLGSCNMPVSKALRS